MRDALAFLTVLPAGRRTGPPGRAAIAAFPLVGLLVGVLWWGAGQVGTRLWGPAVGAALALAADLLVTGGLHLDGLADEADGIACRLPPEEAVTVMRQGTVGAIGASAAAIVLLVRFALLSAAFTGAEGGHTSTVIAVPAAGRFAMVWTMARSRRPADRPNRGRQRPRRARRLRWPDGVHEAHLSRRANRAQQTHRPLRANGVYEDHEAPEDRRDHGAYRDQRDHEGPRPPSLASEIREAARGLPLLVSGAAALMSAWVLAGSRSLGGVVGACLVAEANARWAGPRLGGVTGDVIGAGGLLGETAMLAAVATRL